MAEHLYLDAPSLVYRAFFAWPTSIKGPHGRPVNAVRGFMEMTTRLLTDRRPAEVVAVFDSNYRPEFRVAAYPGYKASRPDDPPELPRQFDVLAEVLDAAGVRRAESPGLEADDAIATLVEKVPGGERYLVVTGDRDLLCLVRDPEVGLLFTVKGVTEMHEFDEAAVAEKYGIPPESYPDFATLRGDPSDGLPGVAGIGPVRAVKLLKQFGSVDGILSHLDELPPKQAAAFEVARDYLEAMKTVVALPRNAPIEQTSSHPPDEVLVKTLSERNGLGSSGARLVRALRNSGGSDH
ncbi:MAG TPA: 5'-3' exonuclease [Actinomycetota bacterium]|nr:5'-3' exonuclease [Actinomycetota bacterium]